jgi:Flp pilus assembly protein TadG
MASRRGQGTAGEVTGAVLLLPVVVTMVFLVIHAAVVYHARSVVAAAAQDAARVAQADGGSAAGGRAVAEQILRGSDGLLPAPSVQIERSPTTVTVTVSGQVRGPIPWLRPTVMASAGGPVERFVPESDR